MGMRRIAHKGGAISRFFDESMLHFFEPEDAKSLAREIVGLRREPKRRAAVAREVRRRFAESFSWTAHKRVFTELVGRLSRAA